MVLHPIERILIVDDDADYALILKQHLEEAGHTTSWAADGEAAFRQLYSNGFGLVLLDVKLPGINGIEILKRLRSEHFDAPVIMMATDGNEDLAVECMRGGATDYLAKPFNIDDAMPRIELAISNRRTLKKKLLLKQEKEDFIFMLSHDMKNPITAAIGSIDIMREGRLGPVTPDQVDYLQSAIESCEDVVTMINNLVDLQRLDTGRMKFRIAPVNVCMLIDAAARHFSPAAERENIALTSNVQTNMPEIAVDSAIMARVFANLIGNALKFVPEEGAITLSCDCILQSDLIKAGIPPHLSDYPAKFSAATRFVHITIADDGTGISSNDLGNISERYFQEGNASERIRGGAGLGLAFSKKTIESFNGCIWTKSGIGEGSQFIILLPEFGNEPSRINK